MIILAFDNWKLKVTECRSQQFDNLTIPVLITNLPEEFQNWKLYIQFGTHLDLVNLSEVEDYGYGCVLTNDQLAFSGNYALQVLGVDGERERHTNIVNVLIPRSISGDANWPELPTAFSQAVQRAEDAADDATEAAEHYPYIDSDTHRWMVWDVDEQEFVDSGINAEGEPGEVYMRVSGGYIQYSVDNYTWINLVALDDLKGEDGNGIASAVLNADYTLTLTFTDGTSYTTPSIRGASGYSPVVTITSVTGGTQVTITDATGAHTFTVMDGEDGHTPIITASKSNGVTTIYVDSVSVATISDGIDGHTPVITASKSNGVTTIYVDGTAVATINDGTDGITPSINSGNHHWMIGETDTGVLAEGTDGTDGVTFTPSVSNAGVISWTNDGGRQNPQSVDLVAAVLAALPTWTGGSY